MNPGQIVEVKGKKYVYLFETKNNGGMLWMRPIVDGESLNDYSNRNLGLHVAAFEKKTIMSNQR